MRKKLLILGNGYLADNLMYSLKTDHDITVYARNKSYEYDTVNYIYGSLDKVANIKNEFDIVYILSGISRPYFTNSLSEFLHTNVYLLSKILEFAKLNNSKVFYPATSLALSPVTNKLNYYAYSHTIAINLIKQYHSFTNLPYSICYLHNVYGNLTNYIKKNKMVVDVFIESYHNKQAVQLINSGNQKRIFTHISDVVSYMNLVINTANEEVNLVKQNQMYSVKELADMMQLNTYDIDNQSYSVEDPYINPIDLIEGWEEKIDIKQWIINNVITK